MQQCGYLFKLSTSDTYMQNSRTVRFKSIIMDKACVIRLFANLPYELWKEIVATTIYFYN